MLGRGILENFEKSTIDAFDKLTYKRPLLTIRFLVEALKHAIRLLFSVSSLSAIYRLFIDEHKRMSITEIGPDKLYEAFTYLMDQLCQVSQSVNIKDFDAPLTLRRIFTGLFLNRLYFKADNFIIK